MMAYFSSYPLCFHIIACLVTATHGTYYPETIYLGDKCGQTYLVGEDTRIKLASTIFLPTNTTCSLRLRASSGFWLIAQFLSYYMNRNYTNEYGRCEFESLQLYNVYGEALLPGNNGYCGMQRPISVFDLGASGNFDYTTYQKNQITAADVELLVTAVKVKHGSDCPSDYFDCYYNRYCVSNAVTCNGYNDCGNNRDETAGCPLSAGVIAAIVVVVIFIFGCVAVTVLCVLKHRLRHRYQRL